GPRAIAGNPWSRSGQKMWILGPTAGGQSGQKATKFETAQSQEPGQDRRDVKCPKASIRTQVSWLSGLTVFPVCVTLMSHVVEAV
ncbi:hypothetical protein K443DRAFT_107998, partial [Laccaria amethystina LaAM-08-1]